MNTSDWALDLPDFLREGIRFACTQCGACCTGAPGKVRVNEADIAAISAFLGETPEQLRARVCKEDSLLLRERTNGDCVFFEDQRCQIHAVKPKQCRLYPFWFRNFRSEDAWARTCEACPGIGTGPVIPPDEILRQVQEDLDMNP